MKSIIAIALLGFVAFTNATLKASLAQSNAEALPAFNPAAIADLHLNREEIGIDAMISQVNAKANELTGRQ